MSMKKKQKEEKYDEQMNAWESHRCDSELPGRHGEEACIHIKMRVTRLPAVLGTWFWEQFVQLFP